MNIYINGTGCVSPLETAIEGRLPSARPLYDNIRLKSAEPDYKQWIDIKMIRRMSRVIKMGVAAAQLSLQEAGISKPEGIITGTAYGCLDDTGVFLTKMINQNEEMLTPTAFIQSTHNTVAGQIALLLECHAYNSTFVHKGFSFEHALIDSIMQLREGKISNILAGAMDELTNHSFNILSRFNLFKHAHAGEGAACFVLSTEKGPNAIAKLKGVSVLYKPESFQEVAADIVGFLAAHNCSQEDVDLVITGRNGDPAGDAWYEHVENKLFSELPVAQFKHLCGEYPTANAFGTWMASRIIASQEVTPAVLFKGNAPTSIKKVLLYNHHDASHHSMILLSIC